MKIISDDQLNEKIQSGAKTMILFSAEWCGPCKILKPTLEKIEKELPEGFELLKADVGEAEKSTKKFNIKNIPTCVLLDGENEIGRFSGVKDEGQIKNFLKEHLILS